MSVRGVGYGEEGRGEKGRGGEVERYEVGVKSWEEGMEEEMGEIEVNVFFVLFCLFVP